MPAVYLKKFINRRERYAFSTIAECVEAWRSHATLEDKQVKNSVLLLINLSYLDSLKVSEIEIPYTTRIW